MSIVTIHEAKTHFSKLIKEALAGEEIIISKGKTPLVRLVPFHEELSPRKGGQLKGLIEISEDFDAPLPEELRRSFQGNGEN